MQVLRKIATLPIFAAVVMMIAMMTLPHHHHHEFLVIAHYDCSQAAEHDERHHENGGDCAIVRFISTITRDDGADDISLLLKFAQCNGGSPITGLPVIYASLLPTIETTGNKPAIPDFDEALVCTYVNADLTLRAPPAI